MPPLSEQLRTSLLALITARPRTVLCLSALLILVPVLSKPFNMDDPLFIWAARHIQTDPFNPFGFDVNWYGKIEPMSVVTKNPPLACYYIAGVGACLGWSEVALHAAFLLPACAVLLGTHRLARRWCRNPITASFMVLFTPVFLVSSSTVMCDTLMLAFWVWAVVFWMEASDSNSMPKHLLAGLLALFAAWTKYFGVALVPLLGLYSIVKHRKIGRWCLGLVPGVIGTAAWDFAGQHLYGRSVLFEAASYAAAPATVASALSSKFTSILTALDFTGGCLAVCAFAAVILMPRQRRFWIVAGTILFAVLLFLSGAFLRDYGPIEGSARWYIQAQMAFWAVAGSFILVMICSEFWQRRDAETLLLVSWGVGAFLFAAAFNWTVNGRSILPMAPPVAILLARKMGELRPPERGTANSPPASSSQSLYRVLTGTVVAGAVLAIFVLRADVLFAEAARASAIQTVSKFAESRNLLWFQGHWGFQYYMQQLGAKAVDEGCSPLQRGDLVAVPVNNGNYSRFRPELVIVRELLSITGPRPRYLTTMRGETGAGFYAANRGPLAFAWGSVPEEKVAILSLEPHQGP